MDLYKRCASFIDIYWQKMSVLHLWPLIVSTSAKGMFTRFHDAGLGIKDADLISLARHFEWCVFTDL